MYQSPRLPLGGTVFGTMLKVGVPQNAGSSRRRAAPSSTDSPRLTASLRASVRSSIGANAMAQSLRLDRALKRGRGDGGRDGVDGPRGGPDTKKATGTRWLCGARRPR